MKELEFLNDYNGETTDQLLALEGKYRIDSLVLAFEAAIDKKALRLPITNAEEFVLAIEALEREVNNGGFGQLFTNSSNEYVGSLEEALRSIGCPKAADIVQKAIAALNVGDDLSPDALEEAANSDDEGIAEALEKCDSQFMANDEPIADRLFSWIKKNRRLICVGDA